MARLWVTWEGDGESISSVTIQMMEPNDLLEPTNHRMSVVFPKDEGSEWRSAVPDTRTELCRPYLDDDLTSYENSTQVNNPENDNPAVIEPLEHGTIRSQRVRLRVVAVDLPPYSICTGITELERERP